jgi:uncharacterized membrane protein YdbT with pleckstrin-like domain
MAFPRKLLLEGEELVIDARPHWIALAGPVLATIAILAGVIAALVKIDNGTGKLIVAAIGLVLFLIYPVRRFIKWVTSHFVVTSQRLVHRVGLIAKGSMEIPLTRITDVRFDQNIFQRMIGAGNLIVESAGERGREVFDDVRRPEHIQRVIYERTQTADAQRAGGPVVQAPSTTEELARLADLRDRGVLTEEEFQAQKAKLLGG